LSKPEQMVIDDLIVLGRGCPEEIRNGRRTICVAGFSASRGFIRIYPTRWDSPLKRWSIIKVPVERPIRPKFNGRPESWKIIGSKREWRRLSDKIEVVGEFPRKKRARLISSLIDGCVEEIYDSGRTLGIIKPTILEHYFEEQKDFTKFVQKTLDGRFRVKIKSEYPIEPRIKYACSDCKVGRGFHDQQLIEWGVFEWLRKKPTNVEQVWENLHLDDEEWEKYFLVGNMYQYPTAFLIISVIRWKKSKTTPNTQQSR
jgi:hypothetical protein